MQPTFRQSDSLGLSTIYETSEPNPWALLRKGGPNGLVSVVTLLVWWGQALSSRRDFQEDSSADWKAVVVDATKCFEHMIMEQEMSTVRNKRKGEPMGKEKGVKRYVIVMSEATDMLTG
jgi:hypothetical protein